MVRTVVPEVLRSRILSPWLYGCPRRQLLFARNERDILNVENENGSKGVTAVPNDERRRSQPSMQPYVLYAIWLCNRLHRITMGTRAATNRIIHLYDSSQ
jgi:hypothetical protein